MDRQVPFYRDDIVQSPYNERSYPPHYPEELIARLHASHPLILPAMAGPNLEVFKFGMYIMFPIGIMFYYGHNLDKRFQVPDFWPKPEQTHKIPFERDEIKSELDRLRAKRLYLREQRLKREQALNQNQE
ncbi:hypothetical protein V501_03209 [Pseudogymnoascus sp. VKM F-4519 (FW-2642)]|nr:hypothetical protein V501_03209 [Pseudogymnoascus sp. VKM F-4519 (FW-2642)]